VKLVEKVVSRHLNLHDAWQKPVNYRANIIIITIIIIIIVYYHRSVIIIIYAVVFIMFKGELERLFFNESDSVLLRTAVRTLMESKHAARV